MPSSFVKIQHVKHPLNSSKRLLFLGVASDPETVSRALYQSVFIITHRGGMLYGYSTRIGLWGGKEKGVV